MPCPDLDYGEYFGQLESRFYERRVPYQVTIALTERCNLRCAHCFVHDADRDRQARSSELTTDQWFAIFDQLADAGCLWLLFTGGEPLLRPDFADLYRYAKRKGFLITLFTNGTLLTPEVVRFLQEWYPLYMEISLYGLTQETYRSLTGIPGAFERCMRGIEWVVNAGIPLRLKTMALTVTRHELEAMYEFAAGLGVPFRHDGLLWPAFHGSDVSRFRLPPAEVVALDALQSRSADDFLRLHERAGAFDSGDMLYVCGGGSRSCHIGPDGRLYLCQMSRSDSYDLTSGSFAEGWESLRTIRRKTVTRDFPCLHCNLAGGICQRCPAFSTLEHGDPETVAEYACAIAQERAKRLGIEARLPELTNRFANLI